MRDTSKPEIQTNYIYICVYSFASWRGNKVINRKDSSHLKPFVASLSFYLILMYFLFSFIHLRRLAETLTWIIKFG